MSYFVFFCLLLICKWDTTHFGVFFLIFFFIKIIQQTAKSAIKNDGDF